MRRIAFVPGPPFLLPSFRGDPGGLREACAAAVATLRDPVTVVGAGPVAGPTKGSVDPTPWGGRGEPADDPLPLALAVGSTLLGDRPHALVGAGAGVPREGDLLVVGEGTAKRTLKAPGHFDPRAEDFDAQIDAALASGRPDALSGLDAALAADLWAAGVPVWADIAEAIAKATYAAEVLWSGAPYGVHYVVATWVQTS